MVQDGQRILATVGIHTKAVVLVVCMICKRVYLASLMVPEVPLNPLFGSCYHFPQSLTGTRCTDREARGDADWKCKLMDVTNGSWYPTTSNNHLLLTVDNCESDVMGIVECNVRTIQSVGMALGSRWLSKIVGPLVPPVGQIGNVTTARPVCYKTLLKATPTSSCVFCE